MRELLVVDRPLGVPVVLLAERDDHLVEQRVAQPRYLSVRAAVDMAGALRVQNPRAAPACRGPNAYDRPVVRGYPRDWYLQGDRMHVQELGSVDTRCCLESLGLGEDLEVLEWPQIAEIEYRAEVDVEALRALACEHPAAVGELVHGSLRQCRGVVGCGQWADVAGWADQALAQPVTPPVIEAGDRVGLPAVPVRAGQRRDGPGVVEEGVRVGQLRMEAEFIGDVCFAAAVRVDVDLVQHVIAELIEVRAARRAFKWQVVGDQRDGAWLVGADEGV